MSVSRTFLCVSMWVLCLQANGVQAATPAISAGGYHSVGLKTDGTVRTWGDDSDGMLGTGRPLQYASPISSSGISAIKSVSAGGNHTIALKIDGSVVAWGYNNFGQLGDGTTTQRTSPVAVSGLTGVVAISAGDTHSVALRGDGSVWVWGHNIDAQLGDGTTIDRSTPIQVSGLSGVAAISAGDYHTAVLKTDGTVWAWGYNGYGALGDGTTSNRSTPVRVSGLTGVVVISAGYFHTVAVKSDGSTWAWGRNFNGQLGDGTNIDQFTPVTVSGLTGVTAVAAGDYHTVALKADGSVWAWGYNGFGQLGDGTTTDRATPVKASALSGVIAISTGGSSLGSHTIALKADGSVWAWGWNLVGQLGDGTTTDRSTPVAVNGLTGVVGISAGSYHNVALKSDSRVVAWGYDGFGQLGDGAITGRSTAIEVPGLTGVVGIAGGFAHTLAVKGDGSVWAWGLNIDGQLGDGSKVGLRSTPGPVSGLTNAVAVSAGGYHSVALKGDGSVSTWGDNSNGQLGDGTTNDRSPPVTVNGLAGVVAVSAGFAHTVALKSDGSVWAWGWNVSGQLGDGTTTEQSTPVQVGGLTNVIAISAAVGQDGRHTVALKSDGTVWTWGRNHRGQLGDGTTTDRLTPVRVSGLTGVIAIAAGFLHTVAVKSDGRVWAWGDNYIGQLGDGTTVSRASPGQSTPVLVNGLTGMVAVSAGDFHTLALKADASVWSWGANQNGPVGDGTLAHRSSPVVVLRENGAGSVAANNWFLDLNPAIIKIIPLDRIPVFLAVASSAANDVTASIQYRAADVGSIGSVYVFALAPVSKVANVTAAAMASHKGPVARGINAAETPLPCVLAQLNAAGQFTAVTAGTLQAYLTGVLSSQGASVSVLNGVSTALLSGSVFYIGYGSNSTAMINNGTNRSVVTVPGTQTCQPQAPQTGWWWNPAEDGRGFGIEVRGNNLFMSGYLYDETGHATWVVSPGPVALDGSLFNGTLYQVANGQTLTGNYKAPSPPTSPGSVTLSFTDARNGTLIWPGGSIPLVRFDDIIGSGNGATPSFVPENGWWWNESESGRGFFFEIKNNFMFIAGYMYEADGRPVWYVAQNPMTTPQSFSSTWLQVANGQTMTGPYKKPTILNSNVGPVAIQFTDATNAMLTLPGGRQIAITRHRF